MDNFKFVQYYHTSSLRKLGEKKLELSREIDVDYSIPFLPPKMRIWMFHPGFTSLHIAIAQSNKKIVHELIKRGADILKQGTVNGMSPIHLAIYQTLDKYRYSILFDHYQHFQLVRELLSMHISTNNSTNPKCKDGLSHFHVACIANHTEAVEFFLQAGEPVDQRVTGATHPLSGYTPLHCAIKYLSINTAEILLAHGADIHAKDIKGNNPLHLLMEQLISASDIITMGRCTIRHEYDKKIEKIETMINLMLKARLINGLDFIDDIGLTGFHVVCMLKDMSAMNDLFYKGTDINEAVNSDSNLWPGWTPLHFAACANIEIFKFLVKNGANFSIKNGRGDTPLDFCSMRYTPKVLHSILSTIENFDGIMLSDGSTKLLHLILAMDDRDGFARFLENLTDVSISVASDSPIWPGYSLLHLSLVMNAKTKYTKLFPGAQIIEINDPQEDYNCTKSEEKIYLERIEMCLTKGCNVSMTNVEGLSPIHLAFKSCKQNVLNVLLNKCEEDVTGPNDLSHLHIACVTHRRELIQKLLNKGSNVNHPTKQCIHWYPMPVIANSPPSIKIVVRAYSTPLHMAVLVKNIGMVEYLLQVGADVYAKDDLEQTPIHLSMEAGNIDPRMARIAQTLIRNTPNLLNRISKNGVSHLHVAAFANEEKAVAKMLQKDASVDQKIVGDSHFTGETPLHVAMRMKADRALEILTRAGANLHAAHLTKKFCSPLQYATDNLSHQVMNKIVNKLGRSRQWDIGALNESGLTLLHLVCALGNGFLAEHLLKLGADPNAQICDDEEYEGKWKGKRPLHVLIYESNFDGVSENIIKVASLLLKYGADVTMKDLDSTPLHIIYRIRHRNFFLFTVFDYNEAARSALLALGDLLLKNQKSYDVNPVDGSGISHFHYACSRSDLEVMKKFLDAGVDVNETINPFTMRNAGQTPLHFSLSHCQREAAVFLINNGANVNAVDVYGNTPLHTLHCNFMDMELVDILLNHGADINAKNLSSETPLRKFLYYPHHTLTLEMLMFFLNRGCKIDLFEVGELNHGVIGAIMKRANPDEFQTIFNTLIKACNLENAIKEGFNAITDFVAVRQRDELSVEDYIVGIERFMEMGCNIDGLNDEENSALYVAANFYNVQAIKALLLHGADINLTNMTRYFELSIAELQRFRSYEKMEVAKILTEHIWKSKLANLNNCNNIDDSPRSIEKLYPLNDEAKQRFHDELIEMENIYITESLSVKDFMSDLGAVAAYPRMLATQRQAVDEFFKRRTDLRKKFPEYCGLLLVQYKKLLARLELLQPARNALSRLCSIQLPHLCVEAILRCLTNEDLKHLAQARASQQNFN